MHDRTDGIDRMEMNWPNTLPHKAFGSMVCVMAPADRKLTVGKRYAILDMDPVALGPGESRFDYYVQDDNELYVWVQPECFADFIKA